MLFFWLLASHAHLRTTRISRGSGTLLRFLEYFVKERTMVVKSSGLTTKAVQDAAQRERVYADGLVIWCLGASCQTSEV